MHELFRQRNFATKFHEALNEKEELPKLVRTMNANDLTVLHDHIISIQEQLEHYKEDLHENKTAKLLLIGTEMINIVCKTTKAKTTDYWLLQFESISECLPYFASTGHYFYGKSM